MNIKVTLTKDQWIEQFAINAMSSYAAIQYDENVRNVWRQEEQYMCYEDAVSLAEQAYQRKLEHESI